MLTRQSRSGEIKITTVILCLVVAAGLGIGYLFLDVWWDSEQMKTIARMSITDWEITQDKTASQVYFLRHMEDKQIPMYIPDDACTFTETRSEGRQIYCYWETAVVIPVIQYEFPKQYEFTTALDDKGVPLQW